jgi:hypothetical protein
VHSFGEIESPFDGLVLADETLRPVEALPQRRLAQACLRPRVDEQLDDRAVVLVMAG